MWTEKCHEVNLKNVSSAFIDAESLCLPGMNQLCVLNWCEQRLYSDWHRQKLIRPFCPTEACAITYSCRIHDLRQSTCSVFILITSKLQRWERTWGYYLSVNVSELIQLCNVKCQMAAVSQLICISLIGQYVLLFTIICAITAFHSIF